MRLPGAGLLGVSVLLTIPATAHAVTVSAPGARPDGPPTVDVDDQGRAIVAWTQAPDATLMTRRRTAAGRLGARDAVARGVYGAVAAAGAAGGAALAWNTFDGRARVRVLRAAVAGGGRRFGRPQTLTTVRASITSPQVFALPGGRYLVMWKQGDPQTDRHPLRYAISSARGRFGTPATLSADTSEWSGFSAARGPQGEVLAAWGPPPAASGTPQGATGQVSYASLAPGATRFGPTATISAGSESTPIRSFSAAGGPGGTVLAWREGGPATPTPLLLRASFAPPAAETVYDVPAEHRGDGRGIEGPVLALPATAAPLAAYALSRIIRGDTDQFIGGDIYAVDRRPDGSYGPPQRLSAEGAKAEQPQAAATAGRAVVMWSEGSHPRRRNIFAVRGADGRFTPARDVTSLRTPQPAVLAASRALALAAYTSHGTRARPGVVEIAVLASG